MEKLIQDYKHRSQAASDQAQLLSSRYNQLGLVRLGLFIGGVAVAIWLWNSLGWGVGLFFIGLFIYGFAKFVFWHQAILKEKKYQEHLAIVNQNEIAFLQDDYSVFENGEEFLDAAHPYTVDLDVFGDYSVFQYFNRTTTAIGKNRLADYLKGKYTSSQTQKEEILARQKAVLELREQLDWRQGFQATGMATVDHLSHLAALKEWLSQEPVIASKASFRNARYWVPLLTIGAMVATAFILPWQLLVLFFLPSAYFLKTSLEEINRIAHQTGSAEKVLAYYGELMNLIETKDVQSPKLQTLKNSFFEGEQTASQKIKRLSYLIGQLNVRNNFFAIFFNLIGLWDIHWTIQLENWKTTHRKQVPQWFDALAEIEALLSLATVFYNRKDWIMPTITAENEVDAIEMGHPLIAPSKRICNDIHIPTKGHIKLVTGSNMAGKSTMLRTVGLTIIMAMAGAPVCANTFQTPLLQVYTSMRTQDALHESTSSFYAELKRLKFIIEAVEQQTNIFFLLDEILKGTNSNDRHTGSKALIQQLIKSKGSGIIATHDLELGALEASYGGAIENLCMEVAVDKDQLHFDYKIKKGVSKSFNATLLMKNMGIRIEE